MSEYIGIFAEAILRGQSLAESSIIWCEVVVSVGLGVVCVWVDVEVLEC